MYVPVTFVFVSFKKLFVILEHYVLFVVLQSLFCPKNNRENPMEKIIVSLLKVGNGIDNVCRIVLGLQMLIIVFLVIMQLLLRPLDLSVRWAYELATLTFVWSVMIGSAVAVKSLLHIGLDSVVYALKPKPQFIMRIVSYLFLFIGLFVFIYASTSYTLSSARSAATMPFIQMKWVFISLPLSGIIMFYHSFVQFLELIFLGEVVVPQVYDEDDFAERRV